jgi:hypothetical protein
MCVRFNHQQKGIRCCCLARAWEVSNSRIRWVFVNNIPGWMILKPITLICCIETDVIIVQSEKFDKEASILEA